MKVYMHGQLLKEKEERKEGGEIEEKNIRFIN
jgi:hypothetical protein